MDHVNQLRWWADVPPEKAAQFEAQHKIVPGRQARYLLYAIPNAQFYVGHVEEELVVALDTVEEASPDRRTAGGRPVTVDPAQIDALHTKVDPLQASDSAASAGLQPVRVIQDEIDRI